MNDEKTIEQPEDRSHKPAADCSAAQFVRLWNKDDDKSFIHLMASGMDYTICGHDAVGDDMIHRKPPKDLFGRHRVTCPQCLSIIKDCRDYLKKANNAGQNRPDERQT